MPFIPKDHPDLPDFYNIKISFVDGTSEEIEVVSHKLMMECALPFLELFRKDDTFFLAPLSSIKKYELDKSYTKILELQRGIKKEAVA